MSSVKGIFIGVLSLLLMLIVLSFTLKLAKKTPLIGGLANKAEELAHI